MNISFETTELLDVEGGQIAYDVIGEGPLVVLAHAVGESRRSYREVAALLAGAGFRVARMDLRGHGESSADWASYTRTDTAGDIIALIRALGGPAVVVGHSFSGGAATIAAALAPELVTRIVELGPFTRAQGFDLKAVGSNARYRRGISLLMGANMFRSMGLWKRYLDHAVPGEKPAGFEAHLARIEADLRRPGRMDAFIKTGRSAPADAGAKLAEIRCPALVLMGTLDPDWASPAAEGEAVVAAMPAGLGRLEMIDGAGHYPHVQFPVRVADAIAGFAGGGADA